MKSAMLLVVLSIAAAVPAALSAPYAVYEVAVPLNYQDEVVPQVWQPKLQQAVPVRVRRDVSLELNSAHGGGERVGIQGNTNLWKGLDSSLNANAHWARVFGGVGGPPTFGAGLSYKQPRGGASVDVNHTPFGTHVGAQGDANLWHSDDRLSSLDAKAHWEQTFGGMGGPATYGGGLSYKQPLGGASVDVSRTPFGTHLGVQGDANLWHSNDHSTSLDANAHWGQTFGGPWGASRPDYGLGLTLGTNFG